MAEQGMNQDSLTLEETNKVRESLGLAPIGGAVEGSPEPDEDEVAEANYAKRREEESKAKREQEIKDNIAQSRNRNALNAKLKGSSLGAANADDSLSAKDWAKKLAKRQKQREKELARKKKELEDADKAVYGESDLAGIKVGHGADDFETGEDVILTLKDSKVLGEDEDELQNVNIAENEAVKAAKERKRKAAAQYTGLDDEEFDEDRIGKKADVLGKYDDGFSSGKVKTEGFRLGAPIEQKPIVQEDTEMVGSAPATKIKLGLDFAKDFEVSDYMKEGDAGFKQRKKKKAKRSTRKADADEDGEGMDVDAAPTFTRRVVDDGPQNLVDDDDLQAALARSRRTNAKSKPKMRSEDLAAQIAQRKEEEDNAPQANGDEDGRITFDDTSEFVRNVNAESLASQVKRERAATPAGPQAEEPIVVKIERGEEGEDQDMDSDEDEDETLAEMAAREGLSLPEYRLKIERQLNEMSKIKAEDEVEEEEEANTGGGVASVLNLLRQQGSLKAQTSQDAEVEKTQREYDLWKADFRRREAQREIDKLRARGQNMDEAQREYEKRRREQQELRDAMDLYKSYKPNVDIKYHDEFGREMTPKEAWRSLSHKFHGKTSGRMKTEKRMKKIEEERKQLKMNSGDTPTGMTSAFARRQEKTGEAHMVLSVGNKGSVQMGESKPKIRR